MQSKTKSNYHHGNLRQALINLGRSALRQRGADNITIAAVAAGLNVSTAAVYRHFADKEAYIDAIAEAALQDLLDFTDAAYRDAGCDAVEALVASSLAYLRFAQDQPHDYELIHKQFVKSSKRYPRHADDHGRFEPAVERISQLLRQYNIDGQNATDIAMGVWGIQHGIASLAIRQNLALVAQDAQPQRALELSLRALIKGLLT